MHSEMPVRLGHAKNGRAVRRRLDKPAPKPAPDHTAGLELTRNELHQRGGAERGVYAQTQRKAAKLSHPKAGASAPSSDSQVARVMRATKKGTRVFVRRGFAPPRSRDYPRRKGHGPIGLLGVSETRNPTLARAVLWQKPPHR